MRKIGKLREHGRNRERVTRFDAPPTCVNAGDDTTKAREGHACENGRIARSSPQSPRISSRYPRSQERNCATVAVLSSSRRPQPLGDGGGDTQISSNGAAPPGTSSTSSYGTSAERDIRVDLGLSGPAGGGIVDEFFGSYVLFLTEFVLLLVLNSE